MTKKILLITYTFPPKSGIGGRRWAKFSKILAERGWEIFVVCSKKNGSNESQWTKDVKNPKIKVFPLETNYPRILDSIPKNLNEKILYRFWLLLMKFKNKGRIYDVTSFWKTDLISFCKDLILKEKILNVICTIPQFSLAYYSALIKKEFPEINLILDYRDPWTNNQTFHGFNNISSKRKLYELKIENYSIEMADWVVSTTSQMTNWAIEKCNHPEKCLTISNGYDVQDFSRAVKSPKSEPKLLLFAGNLYNDLNYVFAPFLKTILEKEKKDSFFHEKINFLFFGNINDENKVEIKKYGLKSLKLFGFVSQGELNKYYNEASAFLLFSVPDHAFNFNTKFFEYLSFKKPIFHFSNNGDVSKFIEDNSLGFGFEKEEIKEKFSQKIDLIINETLNYNEDFEIKKFEIKNLVDKYESLLV